ncbi:MAG: hypothetical protein RSD47_02305 [Romboutsia sp.]
MDNQIEQNKGLGLSSFSYADFVLVSSTISYALSEELNDIDLELFIVFLGMMTSDLALLTAKKSIKKATAVQKSVNSIESEDINEESDVTIIGRSSKVKKRKCIKRIKKIKKK